MEIPVKIACLRLCTKETKEKLKEYVQRFRKLASSMKDTPSLNEIDQICATNLGPVSWYLTASPRATFEDLFECALMDEEFTRPARKAP